MPKLVSEITQGTGFSRSRENGTVADEQNRIFKIALSYAGEQVDFQSVCGVMVGNPHPTNLGIFCVSADARFDGESRMVLLCTFVYKTPQSEGDEQPPDVRPANWSTSSGLIEQPVYTWKKRGRTIDEQGLAAPIMENDTPAVNAAGDHYDAITKLVSIVNISIEQREFSDPTRHNLFAGYINDEKIVLGSLSMSPHTVMFRGCSSEPYTESYGGQTWRGWKVKYEFAFKRNETKIFFPQIGGGFWPNFPAGEQLTELGWDIAVPQSGFNAKAFSPPGDADQDPYGQPLMHEDANKFTPYAGRVKEPLALPAGTTAGDRVRACVKVFSFQGGGTSQSPSASPIPLNLDGTPRKESADPKVIVQGYQVQPSINFTQTFQLRLQ